MRTTRLLGLCLVLLVAPAGCLFPDDDQPDTGATPSEVGSDVLHGIPLVDVWQEEVSPEVIPMPDVTPLDDTVATVPPELLPAEDIYLSPSGRFIVRVVPGQGSELLQIVEIGEGSFSTTTVGEASGILHVGFSPVVQGGEVAFVLASWGTELMELSLESATIEATHALSQTYSRLVVSPGGGFVGLGSLPTSALDEAMYDEHTYDLGLRRVGLFTRATGALVETLVPYAIRDLSFDPSGDALMVTMSYWKETGLPEAAIWFLDTEAGAVTDQVAFDNCAADLVVMPEGPYALLSPNRCFTHTVSLVEEIPEEPWEEDDWEEWWDESDPISLVDMAERTFLGTVPGFGPLALSPAEPLVVGFTRKQAMMLDWNWFQTEPVGLLFLHLDTLDWEVMELGDDEPTMFFSPDGVILFMYMERALKDKLRMLDMTTKEVELFQGPETDPAEHVWGPKGRTLYMVDDGELRSLTKGLATIDTHGLGVTVDLIDIRPQGDYLILGEGATAALYLVDLATLTVTASLGAD